MNIEECPHCHADLRDKPIPEEDKKFFGDKEYFSRLIGIEDDSYDGVSYWCCPECWTVWNRFTGVIDTKMKDEEWFKAMVSVEQAKDEY